MKNSVLGWEIEPAHNTLYDASPLNPEWARGSARCSARLTHIALACKPLEILVSVCLFRLGQRRIQVNVSCNTNCAGVKILDRPGLRPSGEYVEQILGENKYLCLNVIQSLFLHYGQIELMKLLISIQEFVD